MFRSKSYFGSRNAQNRDNLNELLRKPKNGKL